MNHQITFEELGIIPKQIDRSIYASPCGGCVCTHCANSVECIESVAGEAVFVCFNCDECKWYGEKGIDNWKQECSNLKITDAHAKSIRRTFKVLQIINPKASE